MKFGPVAASETVGAIVAHSLTVAGQRLRKGHRLTDADVQALVDEGIDTVIVARLEEGDIGEDEAARIVADTLAVPGLSLRGVGTGRVNLHAEAPGVLRVDATAIAALNAIDPSITLATLADFEAVSAGQMVATVKIIPLALAGALCEAAGQAASGKALTLKPYRAMRVGLIQTELPTVKASVLDKTARVTEARLALSGSTLAAERRTAHTSEALAVAIREMQVETDMLIIFGASAVSDENDVIPSGIREAGGTVQRVGMPVDPGNLIVLGDLAGKPVIGAPGCARSAKLNGFDWVLQRLLAGIAVTSDDIAAMGVGGLLSEITSRPQPREAPAVPPSLAVAVLAAGRSTRMGTANKLLARFDGEPLIRRTLRQTIDVAGPVHVVTGHEHDRIEAAISGMDVAVVHNPDYSQGLSTSLRTAIAAVPETADGLVVTLADMPRLTGEMIGLLAARFRQEGGHKVVRAVHDGKPGNPVILPRSVFQAASLLTGDVGARHLIAASGVETVDVELGAGASLDVDTPDALGAAGGSLE